MEDTIQFDILLRSTATAKGLDPSAASTGNVRDFYPTPETIERCRRWLVKRGITCYPSNFGLACSSPPALFERVFDARLEGERKSSEGKTIPRLLTNPTIPEPIADIVEQIKLSPSPDFFD